MLKMGDIVFVKNDTFISKLIKRFTNSDYSHCGIIISPMHIYETNYNINSSIQHFSYNKNMCDIYRVNFEFDEEKFKEFISNNIGNKYDFMEILKIIFRINKADNDNEYICSTLVRDAFKYASGIDLVDENIKVCTPEDIAKSKYLTKIDTY